MAERRQRRADRRRADQRGRPPWRPARGARRRRPGPGMSTSQAQPEDAPDPAPAAGPEPLAQGYSVVWHNPDPEYYVEGSGLVRLDGGDFVAVVPVVPRV